LRFGLGVEVVELEGGSETINLLTAQGCDNMLRVRLEAAANAVLKVWILQISNYGKDNYS